MPSWFLKKGEEVYGPAAIELLQSWAADGRIAPEDHIAPSVDGPWQPCYEVSELDMNWKVRLDDETYYGPVHILALKHSLLDGSVDPDAEVLDTEIDQRYQLSTALAIALIEQNRLLEGEAEQSRATLQRRESAHKKSIAELEIQREKLERQKTGDEATAELSAKLEQLERNYATRAKQVSTLREEVEKLQQENRELAEREPEPAADGEQGSFSEVMKERDRCERDSIRWQRLYEETSEQLRQDKEAFDAELTRLQRSEIEQTARIDNMKREISQLQSSLEGLSGDEARIGDMIRSYTELSARCDDLIRQLSDKDRQLDEAIQLRHRSELDLNDRISHLQEQIRTEQKAAIASRQVSSEVERQHHDLLRSYRDLNERYIQLKENQPGVLARKRSSGLETATPDAAEEAGQPDAAPEPDASPTDKKSRRRKRNTGIRLN